MQGADCLQDQHSIPDKVGLSRITSLAFGFLPEGDDVWSSFQVKAHFDDVIWRMKFVSKMRLAGSVVFVPIQHFISRFFA